jgi:ATP-dependent RNA helicase RhlE
MPFASLGLSPALVRVVSELGYRQPTAIQREAIPAILRAEDVWAAAPTGSGKTAAFLLPLLERLSRRDGARGPNGLVRVLIVVPTRELAAQTASVAQELSRWLTPAAKVCVAFGGVSENPQMMALRGGADILIATPGRLLDLARKNAVQLAGVDTLVLDEADRLLALGFGDELAQVILQVPSTRQTLLFSATFPPQVEVLAR